jgi:hypothetical protein
MIAPYLSRIAICDRRVPKRFAMPRRKLGAKVGAITAACRGFRRLANPVSSLRAHSHLKAASGGPT